MAIVALDEQGKPNFNLLQNSRSAESHIMFYAFRCARKEDEELVKAPLSRRREFLASTVKPHDHVARQKAARAVAEIEAARYARLLGPVGAVLDFILRRPSF
jgi:ATP-dependent DNA ligase